MYKYIPEKQGRSWGPEIVSCWAAQERCLLLLHFANLSSSAVCQLAAVILTNSREYLFSQSSKKVRAEKYSPAYKYRQLTKTEMNNCAKLTLCYINFSFHCKFFKLIGGAYRILVYGTFLNCCALFVQNRLASFSSRMM